MFLPGELDDSRAVGSSERPWPWTLGARCEADERNEARAASQESTFGYPRSSASLPAKAYPAKASAYRQVGVG